MSDDKRTSKKEDENPTQQLEQLIQKFIEQRLSLLRDKDAVSKRQLRSLFFMPKKIPVTPCKSSNIQSYGYNERSKTLSVVFKGGGEYRYLNVEKNMLDLIEKSESKGKAMTIIKVRHGFVKIDKEF